MLSKQNKLISKLKAECKRQAAQIETILKKHRYVKIGLRNKECIPNQKHACIFPIQRLYPKEGDEITEM